MIDSGSAQEAAVVAAAGGPDSDPGRLRAYSRGLEWLPAPQQPGQNWLVRFGHP